MSFLFSSAGGDVASLQGRRHDDVQVVKSEIPFVTTDAQRKLITQLPSVLHLRHGPALPMMQFHTNCSPDSEMGKIEVDNETAIVVVEDIIRSNESV